MHEVDQQKLLKMNQKNINQQKAKLDKPTNYYQQHVTFCLLLSVKPEMLQEIKSIVNKTKVNL